MLGLILVALFVGVVIGYVIGAGGAAKLRERVKGLEAQLVDLESTLSEKDIRIRT